MKRIALACPMGVPHFEEMIHGVLRYARDNQCDWSFVVPGEPASLKIETLEGWRGDGIIAYLETEQDERSAIAIGLPVVNLSGALHCTAVPRVCVDHTAIGRLAAEHFMERGFQRFAFYGVENHDYSRRREDGFRGRLRESGYETECLLASSGRFTHGDAWQHQHDRLVRWLETLRPPVAVFAVSDYRARHVLDACAELHLAVPREVALLGVDNAEIVCAHCDPPLSSVSRNSDRVGYEAAQVLELLMDGKARLAMERLIPPDGVVTRRSTDVLAAEDPRLAAAIALVQNRLDSPLTVETLVEHVGVSRRWLEYAFNKTFHCTPNEFLNQKRVERAKVLLKEDPRMKLFEVAAMCGFNSTKQMNAVFRKQLGMSAREYRKA